MKRWLIIAVVVAALLWVYRRQLLGALRGVSTPAVGVPKFYAGPDSYAPGGSPAGVRQWASAKWGVDGGGAGQ